MQPFDSLEVVKNLLDALMTREHALHVAVEDRHRADFLRIGRQFINLHSIVVRRIMGEIGADDEQILGVEIWSQN